MGADPSASDAVAISRRGDELDFQAALEVLANLTVAGDLFINEYNLTQVYLLFSRR